MLPSKPAISPEPDKKEEVVLKKRKAKKQVNKNLLSGINIKKL